MTFEEVEDRDVLCGDLLRVCIRVFGERVEGIAIGRIVRCCREVGCGANQFCVRAVESLDNKTYLCCDVSRAD